MSFIFPCALLVGTPGIKLLLLQGINSMAKTALVIGKFYPLHKGHQYLIEIAIKNSQLLYIIIWFQGLKKVGLDNDNNNLSYNTMTSNVENTIQQKLKRGRPKKNPLKLIKI